MTDQTAVAESEWLALVKTAIFVAADDAHNTWPTPEHPECRKMATTVLAALRGPITEALAAAYEQGCRDVHDNYEPIVDPEFGEAAQDYALAAIGELLEGAERKDPFDAQ